VSDNFHGEDELSPDERVVNVSNMIETVLETI